MRKKYENYIGKKIARLTILGVVRKNNIAYFECECECGKKKLIRAYHIICGAVRSCGCLSTEVKRKRAIMMGTNNRKHKNKCDYCGREVRHYSHGLCRNCYERNRRRGNPGYAPTMSEEERKEKQKLRTKRYREQNSEKIKESQRQYYQKNKEKISEYKKQYWLKKKHEGVM